MRAATCDLLIVGGGPVGLLLANFLGARGIRTTLIEKSTQPAAQSMAIGITPPSMEILRRLALDQVFYSAGIPITRAQVHENGLLLGRLDFTALPSNYPYLLAIPQSTTVQLLQRHLARFEQVTCCPGTQLIGVRDDGHKVRARVIDIPNGKEFEITAQYLVGCDGERSQTRQSARIPFKERFYPHRVVMADFPDETDLGAEAHLFFNPTTAIECFPLPGGKRRWAVQVVAEEPADPVAFVIAQVEACTGYDLRKSLPCATGRFETKWMIVDQYFRGRVLLAGDAAHFLSPIGGQGMNTGFADAEYLAEILPQVLQAPGKAEALFSAYDGVRRKAFKVAAGRAARGMWLGTRRGYCASLLRRYFIRDVLFSPAMTPKLGPYFAMLTVPGNTYARSLPAQARFL